MLLCSSGSLSLPFPDSINISRDFWHKSMTPCPKLPSYQLRYPYIVYLVYPNLKLLECESLENSPLELLIKNISAYFSGSEVSKFSNFVFRNHDIWLKAFLQADNIEKKEIRNIWSLCAQLSLFRPLSPQSPILLSYLLGTKLKKLQQYQNWKNRSRNSEIRKPWNCVECSLSNINWAMTHR